MQNMEPDKPLLTIFTPTFNRAYTLPRLLDSLIKQTYKSFEWLVVDDGSNDNTKLLFDNWCNQKYGFNIRYVYTENGGKHRAINKALDIASGELFFIVDSDDYLIENALSQVVFWYKSIRNDKPKNWVGVCGNKGYNSDQMIGSTFSGDYIDASMMNRAQYGINGDKAEVFITEVLKKYKFPEIQGENFLTEGIVWNRISNDGYFLRYFNEIIYLCGYLEDGLTRNLDEIVLRNFKGYTLYIKELMSYKYPFLRKLNALGLYCYKAKKKGLSIPGMARECGKSAFTCIIAMYSSKIWLRIKKVFIKK